MDVQCSNWQSLYICQRGNSELNIISFYCLILASRIFVFYSKMFEKELDFFLSTAMLNFFGSHFLFYKNQF